MRPIYGILGSILLLGVAIDVTVRMIRYRRMCSCTWRAVMLDVNSSVPMIIGLVGKDVAGTGEPIVRKRPDNYGAKKPWRIKREGDPDRVSSQFFDWQCHERTGSDVEADAYYTQLPPGELVLNNESVKATCKPARWWQFKRTSQNSDDATRGLTRLRR